MNKANVLSSAINTMTDKWNQLVRNESPTNRSGTQDFIDFDSLSVRSFASTIYDSEFVAAGIEKYQKTNLSDAPNNQQISILVNVLNQGEPFLEVHNLI